mmetsp:Transcript_43027/g.136746  ORF Transcript_43027/g.136746 Transcript_43027/m.136746 type:complete len:210 (-) Transcript_43027:193-822(-)
MAAAAASQKQQPRKINGKVIVAGPANTGKTCLIERFVHDRYAADDASHGPTLGCDCHQKSVFIDDTEVRLYLYDTAGQERFADMAASYFRVGEVCLLCFDMSELKSFDSTIFWKRKVSDHNARCTFVLVGTKQDLVDESLDMQPISNWAEENGIPFFPTSALKGGELIKFLFHTVAEKCVRLNRERQLEENDTVKLHKSSIGPSRDKCC